MSENILCGDYVSSADIFGLNFIRRTAPYIFRRHYSRGLRSHISWLLRPEDVAKESRGEMHGGIRIYPQARPVKVLRIFKKHFVSAEELLHETGRYQMTAAYLAPENIAESQEFAVTYLSSGGKRILLCGLQDYVSGNVLDPWDDIYWRADSDLFRHMKISCENHFFQKIRSSGRQFIMRVKELAAKKGLIPDLAGIGNILLSADGNIKLVDINNVSTVDFGQEIRTDDKGFPVCDKSVEALALLEEKLLGSQVSMAEKLYRFYLHPERKARTMEIIRKKFLPAAEDPDCSDV
ncbi:MAG: hypothetical protein V2I97_03375 [Desulfococcaceae bacterium]|nr:hypothetical protein [Desulfococcaceae bacterium]